MQLLNKYLQVKITNEIIFLMEWSLSRMKVNEEEEKDEKA